MDHRAEPSTWAPGTAPAGTGAAPPDLDETDDDQFDGGPAYAAGPDDSDAPGFGDMPVTGSGLGEATPDGPGFGDVPAEAPDFDESHEGPPGFAAPAGPAFGEVPPEGVVYGGEAHDDAAFGGPAAAAPRFGDAPAFGAAPDGPAFQHGQAPHPGFGPQGFTGAQDGDYNGPYTGEFRGAYIAGYGAPAQEAGMLPGEPGMPAAYGEQAYQAGEDGTRPQDPAYSPNYPPAEPPRSDMTASLRSVRRPRFGKKRDRDTGRQAQLTVSRVEPWSVMKFSFVISLVAFIVLFVAVAVLYAVLSGLGVFSALQHTVSNITSSQGSSGFNLMTYISASRVLGYTGLLGAINVVLITALSTVGAVLYNITADLAGGVEITLKETD